MEKVDKADFIQRVKNIFIRRQQAYQITFDPKSLMAELVLKDLSRFCRAHTSTFHPDARAHAVLEGRREVWLRIQEHLKLSSEEVWQLHGKEM